MKKYLALIIMGWAAKGFSQQDPQYSLYQFNQMTINPAYAGARDALAAVIDFRKQWVNFPGAPSTFAFSIHKPVLNKKVGIGFNAVNDQIGAKNVTAAYLNFSYIAKLSHRFKLSFGLRAGYSSYRFNFNEVNFQDESDAALSDLASNNRGAFDMDGGIFLRSNTFFMGLSSTHINHGEVYYNSFSQTNSSGQVVDYSLAYNLRSHSFFIIGKSFVVNENCLIAPSLLVKRTGDKAMTDLNLNFFVAKKVWFGVFLRQSYGYGALFQVYLNNHLRIGYSYDIGSSGGKGRLGDSHEIMLGYDFLPGKTKTVSPRFL